MNVVFYLGVNANITSHYFIPKLIFASNYKFSSILKEKCFTKLLFCWNSYT